MADLENRWPILAAFWEAFCSVKIGGRFSEHGGRFRVLLFFRNVFLGQICYNFLGVSFTINIGLVSDYFERDRGG